MLSQRGRSAELPRGLDAAWDAARGVLARAVPRTKRFLALADEVLALEARFADLSDARLREQAGDYRAIFRRGRDDRTHLIEAFALIREIAARTMGMKPFRVQVAGALAIEAGCIVEMSTGEGKTLTCTLPATVNGWRGKGCHVVTFNDYLARRDADWMGKLYDFCGVSVAHIENELPPDARRQAYLADVTYGTNKEIAADFLRDRLALGRLSGLSEALLARIVDGDGAGSDRVVQRGLARAIIDEADSILIDEAVTPLIISGDVPNDEQIAAYEQAAHLAGQLAEGEHYTVNHRYREIDLTADGRDRLGELAEPLGGLWHGVRRREELVNQALVARHFYLRGKQYVVQEGKVVIVDDFTGRLMPDRHWRDGLHQAVEAKEALEVNPPKDTFARVSFQRFFRLYRKLSGMTGTAAEAWREFWQIYNTPFCRIPTNKPCIREHLPDRAFATEAAKWAGIVEEIARLHATGRPVLVGSRSVGNSEHLAGLLAERGLDCDVLNATNEDQEAHIVAGAGQRGRITVSTNMAGRGTDIKLGDGVAKLGGLAVIATERHESGRIDRQLYGRAGRQGDPGTAQAFVCLEDELVTRHAPRAAAALKRRAGTSDREITSTVTRKLFDHAQNRAERMALRQRKGVLRTDDWLDEYLGFAGRE